MTPAQIQRRQTAWTVLRYEREMYEATWKLMQLNLHQMFHYTMVNAIVESHSLHLRNLCNFLVGIEPDGCELRTDDELFLNFTDLVERFEEIDLGPLERVWMTPIDDHDGSPAWVLRVMSDCTSHRRDTYNYSSIATALHGPLVALMDQIEKVRIWEVLHCSHEMDETILACVHCGAAKAEVFKFSKPNVPVAKPDETTAEEPCQEGGEETTRESTDPPREVPACGDQGGTTGAGEADPAGS